MPTDLIGMANNSTSTASSDIVLSAGFTLSCVELVVHPVALMSALFTMALIVNTSVLHNNLKCILLGQSAGIVMFEIARVTYVVFKFSSGNVFFQGPIVLQMFGLFGYTLRYLINHVLIAERAMATIKFRTYGSRSTGYAFTSIWLIISIGISAWITIAQNGSPWSVTPFAITSICAVFGVGLAEIIALAFLYWYNVSKYRSSRTGVSLSLNDKYQLSENIRTARQFVPTFALHFVNACVNYGMSFLIFFGIVEHAYFISLGFIVSSLFNSFSGSFVDWITISHHPSMAKRAKCWLTRMARLPKAGGGPAGQTRVEDKASAAQRLSGQPRNIYGHQLLNKPERESHFKMLDNQWMQIIDVSATKS